MVSVIIPSYNSEKYIAKTLDSVCAQTYADFEVLVMNDYSSDRTAEIVESYAAKDSRIHLMNLPGNKGVSHARNTGVRMASGDWIAFLDSDDLWATDKLEKQLKLKKQLDKDAPERKHDFLFTGSSFIDENGLPLSSVLHVPEHVDFEDLLKQNVVSCSSVMIRRELMLKYPMPCSDQVHEDFVTWLTILKKEKIEAYGLDEPLLIYRVMKSSRSGNKLKAAAMTFRAYRHIGLSVSSAFKNWIHYALRSFMKYRKIK